MEVQEVKEQLKAIFRTVINNDKWITKYDKEGEPYHVNIDDTDDKKEDNKQSDTKDGKEEKKSTFKPVKGIMQSLKDDYEAGKINAKEVAKELSKANLTPYLLDDNEALEKIGVKQSDSKGDKKEIIAKAEKSLSSNKFIPNAQKSILKKDLKGEEYKHFADKIEEIQEQIKNAPKMYETDGVKDKKPILHYFGGSYDNYVYEIDKATGEMFGAVNMGYGYELGYSSMEEINSVPSIELDLYFDGKQPKELSKKINNNKEQEMALIEELKKLITKVENTKGEKDMEIENEKVDKRKLIDEVAGIMKSAGCDDEDIRTAIGKMEKIGYDDSEKSADNEKEEEKKEEKAENCGKKVKNEDEKDEKEVEEVKEEVKEDVDNKCKNSKEDYFAKLNEIYNASSQAQKPEVEYTSRADREQAAIDYFKK